MAVAFIFFGSESQVPNVPMPMPMSSLNGQSANDRFGLSVASAGDFNGDGKDDVIVGAQSMDDNNSAVNSGRAFIFFGGITGTKLPMPMPM